LLTEPPSDGLPAAGRPYEGRVAGGGLRAGVHLLVPGPPGSKNMRADGGAVGDAPGGRGLHSSVGALMAGQQVPCH